MSPFKTSVGVQIHPGKVRSENQDRVSRASTPFGELFLLADGVGGQRGGAQAAQYAVDAFVRYLGESRETNPIQALKQAGLRINSDLSTGAMVSGGTPGMSSTVVLALVQGRHVIVGHAGDSRAYLVRGGHLEVLTRDHSVMQRLIAEYHLSPEEARNHPDASVLTQALGQRSQAELETLEFDLQPGDGLLLCSDGLWAYATHDEMQAVFASPGLTTQAVADALLNLAMNNGGGDNISLQYLRFDEAKELAVAKASPKRGMPIVLGAAGLAALVCLTAGITYSNWKHPIPAAATARVVLRTSANPVALPAPVPAPAAPTSTENPVEAPAPAKPVPDGRATRIKVVLLTFPQAKFTSWEEKMKSLSTADVKEVSAGDNCSQLLQTGGRLYYADGSAAQATELQRSLKIPSDAMARMDAEDLSGCAAGSLIASPAGRSVVQAVRQGASDLKKAIEKHSPIKEIPIN